MRSARRGKARRRAAGEMKRPLPAQTALVAAAVLVLSLVSPSRSPGRRARGDRRAGGGPVARAARSLLRDLPQRAPAHRGAAAGRSGSRPGRGARGDAGEGGPQAARRPDAAGRAPASRSRRRGDVHHRAGVRARQRRRGRPEPRARRLAPHEPLRVRQRHPGPAGPGGERRRAAAQRHGRPGFRQQRRRALDDARPDGALHGGRHQDQPRRRRGSRQPAHPPGLLPRVRDTGSADERGHAVRHARRPGRAPRLSARRRIRLRRSR